jgi:hypothetical protein
MGASTFHGLWAAFKILNKCLFPVWCRIKRGKMGSMEKQFLIDDLKLGESWRLFKIMGEFVEGVEGLHDLGPAVSVFGSARTPLDDPYYKKAEALAALFVKNGFGVITGGGGGQQGRDRRRGAIGGNEYSVAVRTKTQRLRNHSDGVQVFFHP